jgi:hypothetical protein
MRQVTRGLFVFTLLKNAVDDASADQRANFGFPVVGILLASRAVSYLIHRCSDLDWSLVDWVRG